MIGKLFAFKLLIEFGTKSVELSKVERTKV